MREAGGRSAGNEAGAARSCSERPAARVGGHPVEFARPGGKAETGDGQDGVHRGGSGHDGMR